ncbi:pilus assembly protein TadG-related protein [Jeongeupia naejangsanensis]|uniref:Putative Flp pilus-assembly TadG-like N-terminal domain-containing protein n=1 Tax=Jeongeupia naejangsanensis TaxID=613195 RepID=A0ABS2BJS0_9NEIS|nr:pilus assembly protein TadG-related protein [Jeongeupia naejangsanensis]MBM3115857.1 hypothetical protein [Jeongeupia naejangsanensis]
MKRQRGSIAIAMGGILLLGIVALGALDIGRLYVERRQLQSIADFAATSAAQYMSVAPLTAAQSSAAQNGLVAPRTLSCFTGRWASTSPNTLSSPAACTASPAASGSNAVRIVASNPAFTMLFLPGTQAVQAEAIAMPAQPYASFMLGSALLELDTSAAALANLNSVLTGLGVTIPLTLADNNALVASQLKIGSLMTQVGAASMDQLLATTLTYNQFQTAVVNAMTMDGQSGATLNAANKLISASLGSTAVKIGDLLNLALLDASSAVQLRAGDLLMSGLQLAQKNKGVAVLGVNIGVGIIKLASINATLVKPAVYAAGRPGYKPDGTPYTKAVGNQSTLQVQALSLLGITVLNISVAVAPATATLTKVRCNGNKTDVELAVTTSGAQVCTWLLGLPVCTPIAAGAGTVDFTVAQDGSIAAPNPAKVGASQLLGIPLPGVDAILLGLLEALGVKLGIAEVKLISAKCANTVANITF